MLTKVPFEPPKDVLLKYFTYKTAAFWGLLLSDISSFACIEPYLRSQAHPSDTWYYPTSLRENDRPGHVGHQIFVKKPDLYRSRNVYLKPKHDL